MIPLIIVLSVIAFLSLLLLLPIRLRLCYKEELCATLSVFGIRVRLYPRKKKTKIGYYSQKSMQKRKDKARRAAEKAAKKNAKKPPPPPTPPKKKTIKDHMRTLKMILYMIKRVQKRARGAFSLHVSEFRALVATGDAASTALLHGAVSQVCSYVLALSEGFIKTTYRAKNIAVVPDFCGTETKVLVRIRLTTNLFRLVCLGIAALRAYLSSKKI